MADPTTTKPPTVIDLVWEHDLVLAGRAGDVQITIDSASVEGPSPMQALAFALAGCMAMDLIHILQRGRRDLRGLRADLTGERSPEQPRRFTRVDLHYRVTGEVPRDQIERAIQLSRDKYCSVWQSMRQDIEFNITYEVSPGV